MKQDIEKAIDNTLSKYFPKIYTCAYAKEEQCGGKVSMPDWICGECYSQYGDGS
jgi:hypothetical protein